MPQLPKFTRLLTIQLLTILLAFSATTSCSKPAEKQEQAGHSSSLLQFVPADTPYLFANPEPLPDDVLDQLEPRFDEMLKAYAKIIRTVVDAEMEKAEEEGSTEKDEAARMAALGAEFSSLMTIEGLRAAGIGRESTMVFYGDGLLPVLRLRLTDKASMESTISRLEEKAGAKMATAEIGNQSYRYAGDEEGVLVLALIENDLVATLMPANHTEELLKSALGLTKPKKSIADSGELHDIAVENNFQNNYLLLVDATRIAATFLDEQSGSNAELLALMEFDPSTITDVCKAEIRELAAIAPRMIAGYTEFSTEQMSSRLIIELRKDIADGLSTLVAPVQGLGLTKGGLFSFGFSLDVLAARAFYSARLDAMEANPFKCEDLAELQAGVAQGREMLKQPIPPIAYSVKGFLGVVDALEGMDIAAQKPPTSVDASFLISTDNPQGLLAMGSMFSAELAALNLQPDGKPVRVELPPVSPAIKESFVAMTDSSLVISVGEGGADRIVELLDKGFDDPKPFMSMFMDTSEYYSFVADSMLHAQSDDPEQQTPPEVKKAMADLMRAMEGWFGETSVKVNFTERGVEIPSKVEFAAEQ